MLNTKKGKNVETISAIHEDEDAGMHQGMPAAAKNKRRKKARITRALVSDRGMTTAEYAVGTVAAAGFGGLLIRLLTSDEMGGLLWGVLARALSSLFGG